MAKFTNKKMCIIPVHEWCVVYIIVDFAVGYKMFISMFVYHK